MTSCLFRYSDYSESVSLYVTSCLLSVASNSYTPSGPSAPASPFKLNRTMRLSSLLHLAFLPFVYPTYLPSLQHVFSNPPSSSRHSARIPTVHESAILARRIMRLEKLGTLSTVFPSNSNKADHDEGEALPQENRPDDVAGVPIGMMEYVADCEPETGNPTLISVTIATSFKNAAAGSNVTLSLRWHPPYCHQYSAAALPRFSLVGYLEKMSEEDIRRRGIEDCYTGYHPDAVTWFPGNQIHESEWVRLVVREVYWFGGFGDRAYIGWITVEDWRGVTEEEIDGARLPGEK